MTLSRRTLLAAALAAPLLPNPAAAMDMAGAAAYSAARRGVSLLVMQAGRIVFEDYPNEGGPDLAWELASGTKSFCGIMAAAAVRDGLLSLDERCADTLTEWRDDPRKSRITIRQLLTLTSGIGGGTIGRPPTYADAVATPAGFEPGERFQYGPAPFQIFGEIVRRRSGDPLAYLTRRIFEPLGVRPQRWRRGADGNPHLPSGAALTARDWATFGRFVMTPAADAPQLDAGAFAACWEGTRANPGYGLTWWLLRPGMVGPARAEARRSGLPTDEGLSALNADVRMAAGAGNQRLYLLPERDLIIVRQASRIMQALRGDRVAWSDTEFLAFFR